LIDEGERAKLRMLATQNNNAAKEIFPEQESGQSRDIAAAKVGMSGKTAEKGKAVINKADELRADGKIGYPVMFRTIQNNG